MKLSKVEDQKIEFKETWRDEYLKWLCGFANADGGSLFIGLDDSGNAIGLKDYKKLLEDLPNKIRDSLGILAEVNLLKITDENVIEIKVSSYNLPISYKGSYYIRRGSTNQLLTGIELEHFILKNRGISWDSCPLPSFSKNDINYDAIENFKNKAITTGRLNKEIQKESLEIFLKKLHLIKQEHLTNAAMLLFSKNPEYWQLGAFIKVGFFESDSDLKFQDEIHGPLLEQVDKVIELLHLKYMKAYIKYEGLQRIERFFVPDEALREAVLNAVCHKDYSSGVPIQISVYDDKLYITNKARLPADFNENKLFSKHASDPLNPAIANVFYLAGYIESWGRGIEKICDSCKKEKMQRPTYTIDSTTVMICFNNVTDNVTDDVIDNVTDITKRQTKILELINQNNTVSTSELAKKLNVDKRTILRDIANLKKENKLERIGSEKNGNWRIL